MNYGIDGPFSTELDGAEFFGAIFDKSGLYTAGVPILEDGQVRPARFYLSRISRRTDWIQSIIGVIPDLAPEEL